MRALISSVLFVVASFGASHAAAQENAAAAAIAKYPSGPVTLVVPFASGGPTDVLARIVAQKLGERLGKPFVVVNKPGAGGNTGSAGVAVAPPDGYSLLLGTVATHGINPSLYKNMPYDHRKDFVAISQVSLVPNVLVVNNDLPVKSVPELIDYLKKNQGKVFYATPGRRHLDPSGVRALQDDERNRYDPRPLTREVARPWSTSSGATVQLMLDNSVTALPQAQAGRVRALAVSTPMRLESAPELPPDRGPPAGLRGQRLARRVRPGRHAQTHRRQVGRQHCAPS